MTIEVRRILVPIDFSEHARLVIDWAVHLAEEHGSAISLVHAYHLPVEFQQLEGAYLPQDFWTNVKDEAQQSLATYQEEIAARGIEVETVVREGYPATVIEEEAKRLEADLIVIGTRGLSGIKHMLLGSIAERVVQKAPCPVLTVKTPD
jgi:nucleotide-binding universal stress UspA family protein